MKARLTLFLTVFLLVYPSWLLPRFSAVAQLGLILLFVISIIAAVEWADREVVDSGGDPLHLPSLTPSVCLLILGAVLLRTPFSGLPVIPVSDAQTHQGPPAVIWEKVASLVQLQTGDRGWATAGAWLFIILVGIFRNQIFRCGRAAQILGAGLMFSILAWAAWTFPDFPGHDALKAFLPPEKLITLQRYPPLGKCMTLLGYGLFGIEEAVLPGIQTAFVIATALLLARWSGISPGQGLVAATGWLFAPVFLSPAYLGHLDAGCVFFVTANLLIAIGILERKKVGLREYELYLGVFFAGLLYKELHLVVFPILIASILMAPLGRRERLRMMSLLIGPPLVIALPYTLVGRISSALARFGPASADAIIPAVAPLVWGFGLPLLLAGLVGLIWAIRAEGGLRIKTAAVWLIIGIAFIRVGQAASYLRHSALFFPPIIIGLSAWPFHRRSPNLARAAALVVLSFSLVEISRTESELVTIRNIDVHYLPYESIISRIPDGAKVYAPMVSDPSHYYLAKTGKAGRIIYERKLWYDQHRERPTLSGMLAEADRLSADFLLLPAPLVTAWLSPHARLVEDHPGWRLQNPGRSGGQWDYGSLPPDLGNFIEHPEKPWRLFSDAYFGRGRLVLFARIAGESELRTSAAVDTTI